MMPDIRSAAKAEWDIHNALVALKEFVAALDDTKFDVFIGTPSALQRLKDARFTAATVIAELEGRS